MPEARDVFSAELNLIQDAHIMQFVLEVFDKLTPEYFWTCPASTTGKYHPEVCLGVGGLVRHTKLVVWWADQMMRAYPPDSRDTEDEVLAACLLHDLRKNGDSLDARGFPTLENATSAHGIVLAAQMCGLRAELSDSLLRIVGAVSSHMGRWSAGDVRPISYVERMVHLADYAASRKVDSKVRELSTSTDDFS